MKNLVNLTGTEGVAYAVKLSRVDVIPVYPITPQTTIIEYIANFIADGEMEAQYINVESEHSAMACAIAAASKGVRTFTATSSQGLLYMHEMLHWASGARLPIVMVNVSRALAPPWNIYNDHQDFIAQRDCGWIQLFAETNQEALDLTIQAFKIAEHPKIQVPVMVNIDGFTLSHTYEPVSIPDQEEVNAFLPESNQTDLITPDDPQTINNVTSPEHYIQFKYLHERAVKRSKGVIEKVSREYRRIFNRNSGGIFEEYKIDGAKACLLTIGSLAGTARVAVDEMRKESRKVGLIILKSYRPFPTREIRELGKLIPTIAVLEKNCSKGQGGALATEVRAALHGMHERPLVPSYIGGLGGRNISVNQIKQIFNQILEISQSRKMTPKAQWLGIKRGKE